jgi:hypothetical protein
MIPRKVAVPNNRQSVASVTAPYRGAAYDKAPSNKPSVLSWAQAGRQNSEGFGGGRLIGGK